MNDLKKTIPPVLALVHEVSTRIMQIYNSASDFMVEQKTDNSPVTEADLLADHLLTDGLPQIISCPVLSEENVQDYSIRKNWPLFWMIDPIDGTKGFIQKNNEFTINISLMKNNQPLLGLIHCPTSGESFYATKGDGAFLNQQKIFNHRADSKNLIVLTSKRHKTGRTENLLKALGVKQSKMCSSAVKFGWIAQGVADFYPRFSPTYEWDIAAGDLICQESGCHIIDLKTGQPPRYNKENLKNNSFIALRKNLNIPIDEFQKYSR